MPEPIHYRIRPHRPEAHLYEVELTIAGPADEQVLSLPAWIPGSYMIRDFAKNIVTLTASDDRGDVAVQKLDKQTWRCAGARGTLFVRYEVYAWDLSVRSAHLDGTHGYFNGTSVFLRVHGRDEVPCTVELLPPPGDAFSDWRVATTLPRGGAELYGFGGYHAADYDELIDHPVEMGRFTLVRFQAAGIPHEMALTGRHRADTERLAADLKKICEYHASLFGPPPVDRYLFQTMVVGEGYGGLEHRSSCSLMCSRDDLPLPGREKSTDRYRNFLGLCSHEYFHTWNVKRIKPAAFQPFDLSREVNTSLLWAFEGITAYYDDLGVKRAGLISEQEYLETLGQTITRVLRNPGRFKQSVSESSFDAWTKFYKQDENAPNAIVSYYVKGALAALGLDLSIRSGTAGERSLDDVMRALWQRYGKPGVGLTEENIESLIEEISGLTLKPYLDLALRGTEELPLAEILASFGIRLTLRPAESADDKGGTPPARETPPSVALGIRTAADPAGVRIATVLDGSPAQTAGLSAGDIIVAVGALRATKETMEALLAAFEPGDRVEIHAFRRDELHVFTLTAAPPPADTAYLTVDEEAGETAARLRKDWLA